MEVTTVFGKNLKAKRLEKGLKQKELAQMTGIAPQTLSGYEGRGILPPLENTVKLAQALDVSLDWLCGLRSDGATGQQEFQTMGDVARAIVALLGVEGVSISEVMSLRTIKFCPPIEGFVTVLLKFQKLQASGEMSSEMVATLLDAMIKKLDSENVNLHSKDGD